MVGLHETHLESRKNGMDVLEDIDLGELWDNHLNPLIAYGLQTHCHPGWQQVNLLSFHLYIYNPLGVEFLDKVIICKLVIYADEDEQLLIT